MDECYRVLKDEGTCWINLGDSYYGSGHGAWSKYDNGEITHKDKYYGDGRNDCPVTDWDYSKYQTKCLCLIPHRFAIGCIDRGWILRNDIIWAKPNGMPESVTDRFSKKHEFIFFFVKQKKYYFDLDSIREKAITKNNIRDKQKNNSNNGYIKGDRFSKGERNWVNENGKNPGDVSDFWQITTKGNKDKHYASYNDNLIKKPILAGCPENGIVLDPFCGTGTTLKTVYNLNRNFIGFDGNPEYCEISNKYIFDLTDNLFKNI